MKEYLLGVVGTVLLSAVLTGILPKGKTVVLVEGIARLVCILSIIAPIITYFYDGNTSYFDEKAEEVFFSQSVIEREQSFIKYYSGLRVKETERLLERELYERFQVEIKISLSYENVEIDEGIDSVKITKIYGKTTGTVKEGVLEEIKAYLVKNYCILRRYSYEEIWWSWFVRVRRRGEERSSRRARGPLPFPLRR